MGTLWLDLETYCDLPIDVGTYRYAERAQILLISYQMEADAYGVEKVGVIDVASGEVPPTWFEQALMQEDVRLIAHNSNFDRTVLSRWYHMIPRCADPSQWFDTMVEALSLSLPPSLDQLCEVLGIPADKAKLKEGKRLIGLFCRPQRDGSRILPADRPEDWRRFVEYARQDVQAMIACHQEMMRRYCPRKEDRWMWLMPQWDIDQRINDRGMAIDLDLARAAVRAADEAKGDADRMISRLTGGEVKTAGQRDRLLTFLRERHGVALPDLTKGTVDGALSDPGLPAPARELLEVRSSAAKSSVTKFAALLGAASSDGRLRGCLQFMGASRTGRWTGKLYQPQNLPRGTMTPDEVEEGIMALKTGAAGVLYEDVMALISNCLRGAIIAPEGHKLVVADLSNIEGRVLSWLARERWKLDAFRAYDRGEGPDLYKATYGRTFGIAPEDVTKKQRQIGKVLELAMGYQGGVGAFATFAALYRVDLAALAEHVFQVMAPERLEAAAGMWRWRQERGIQEEMPERVWIGCECIKSLWREAHPGIVGFWRQVEDACGAVLSGRQTSAVAGPVRMFRNADGTGLQIALPSGRRLTYPEARIAETAERALFTYAGMEQTSRRWTRLRTYAGKIVENVTQAVARDVLAENLRAVEKAGYAIVLSVHDELITETPDEADYTADDLSALMSRPPYWAEDLPLAAAGFEAHRYRKD